MNPAGKRESSVLILGIFLVCYALKNAVVYNFLASSRSVPLLLSHFLPLLVFTAGLFVGILMVQSRGIFIAVYSANIIFIAVFLAYFSHVNSIIHLETYFRLFSEGVAVIRTHSFTFKPMFLIGTIDLPAFLYLCLSFHRIARQVASVAKGRHLVIGLLLFAAIHGGIYLYFNNSQRSTSDGILDYSLVMHHGLLAHFIADLTTLSAEQQKAPGEIVYGKEAVYEAKKRPAASILLIQVESLDASIINSSNGGKFITPFLHELAQRNVYYPYVLSYRSSGVTSDCEFAVLNSIEPFARIPSIMSASYLYPNALPRRLPRELYDIAAFHGNTGAFYDRWHAYAAMGFEHFFDIDAMHLQEVGWGAPDRDVFSFVQNSIAARQGPFFYYVITMSSHEPFTAPRNYYHDRSVDNVQDQLSRDYLNAIAYTDRELRSFVEGVVRTAPDTYIFIYGDHTPFTIKEGAFRPTSFMKDDLAFEFVPLIIITPDHKTYTERKRIASYLDFAATILAATGVNGSIRSNGINLLEYPLRQADVLFRRGVYDRRELFSLAAGSALSGNFRQH